MTHQETIELLPWYVNATLSERERREVNEHLASCAPCKAELEQLAVLRLAVVESADELPAPSQSRFNQAMAQIDAFERTRQSAPAKTTSWLSELRDRIADVLFGWCGPMPTLGRAVVAAQFLFIFGLAGALSYSLWEREPSTTLSGTQQGHGDRSRIKIAFDESITEAQLRQLLGEVHGEIVSGPSAQGLYTIEVPIPPANADQLDRLVQDLRGKQQLIRFAEKEG